MPFYLKELDIVPRVAGLLSVLIMPCRLCPAASLAVSEKMGSSLCLTFDGKRKDLNVDFVLSIGSFEA